MTLTAKLFMVEGKLFDLVFAAGGTGETSF